MKRAILIAGGGVVAAALITVYLSTRTTTYLGREGDTVDGLHPVWADDRGVYTCEVVGMSNPPQCGEGPDSRGFVFLKGIDGNDLPQEMGRSEHGELRYGVVTFSGTVSEGGVVAVDRYTVRNTD